MPKLSILNKKLRGVDAKLGKHKVVTKYKINEVV